MDSIKKKGTNTSKASGTTTKSPKNVEADNTKNSEPKGCNRFKKKTLQKYNPRGLPEREPKQGNNTEKDDSESTSGDTIGRQQESDVRNLKSKKDGNPPTDKSEILHTKPVDKSKSKIKPWKKSNPNDPSVFDRKENEIRTDGESNESCSSKVETELDSQHCETQTEGKDTQDHSVIKPNPSGKPQASKSGSSHTKSTHKGKSKKNKSWQKYNSARGSAFVVTDPQQIDGDSDSETENTGKYKRRTITENHSKFDSEDEYEDKDEKVAESKYYDELFKELRLRDMEKENCSSEAVANNQIPSTVVLPEEFEQELDVFLSLTVPQPERTTSPISPVIEDSESFSSWLDNILEPT